MITTHDIEQGLRNREFLLHYQPKVSLITGQIVGAEALVRWSKNGAIIAPSAFIPLAERSSQIKALTAEIFFCLARDLMLLNHNNELTVSFNVTAQDFEDPVLAECILASIAHSQMPPAALEVEITETQALHADDKFIQNVLLLCNAGVGLVMDDYGTGYSSMDTLSRWPFSTIKIDQGIVSRMLGSEKNATIVRSAIRLGHELKINVVAEGVETPEQYQFLLESGCKTVQGYLVSRPLPPEQFVTFLETRTRCPGVPVGLIHMAIVDHMQWRRQLASYAIRRANLPADAPLRQTDGYPPLSCRECSLGRWYFGPGQLFVDRPGFAALDAPHCAMHDVGHALVQQIQSGASLVEIQSLLDELKRCSIQLVCHLEDLEDLGLAELYRRH